MNAVYERGNAVTGFQVAVIIKRRPAPPKPWLRDSWQVTGVVAKSQGLSANGSILVHSGPDGDDYLWNGLTIRLHKDEVESYYHNLMSDRPCVYVISSTNAQGILEPFLVSACFDEASAYTDTEESVEAVPMPPELYPWIEGYVLTHYVPEPRVKRQRRDWKESDREQR